MLCGCMVFARLLLDVYARPTTNEFIKFSHSDFVAAVKIFFFLRVCHLVCKSHSIAVLLFKEKFQLIRGFSLETVTHINRGCDV